MLCADCNIEMEKDYFNFNSKDKVSLVTIWRCTKCGKREHSQHNVPKN